MSFSSQNTHFISVDNFPHIIKKCRSRETSADSEKWSQNNPSYRQCLITALLANEFLGLDIYAEKVRLDNDFNAYHFFNKDTNNQDIRFCEEQFDNEKILTKKRQRPMNKERMEIILERNPEVNQRYNILKQRFQEEIKKIFR
ncbi:MAG: hypothetical protein WC010_02340 [Candidatus Absconditabacterales bacterium]